MMKLSKRTKIICTLGPATETVPKLMALGTAGMDVARLNFSHGTYEWHGRVLSRIRQVGRRLERPFAVLQDLQGPKIRVGSLSSGGVLLTAGKEIVFSTASQHAPGDIPVTLSSLHRDVKRGAAVLLDDGLLECRVRRVDGQRIHCEVLHGGRLLSHKGLNLPGTHLRITALSDKDRADAQWGVRAGVDFVALSFVRSAADIHDLRKVLSRTTAGRKIKVIGKIEKQEALDHFEEILPLLDAVMIARGDLGIETAATSVSVVQKQLVARCRDAGVPAIIATQMLDSMQRNPRPTRAEISDVTNAVADQADAVMLSGETASGLYPVESVRVMADTIRAMEASLSEPPLSPSVLNGTRGVPQLVGAAIRVVSDTLHEAPIVVLTSSGRTAREVAAVRPKAPIYAMTFNPTVQHQCRLLWGVESWMAPSSSHPDTRIARAIEALVKRRVLKRGMQVVAVSGTGKPGSANRIEIIKVGERV